MSERKRWGHGGRWKGLGSGLRWDFQWPLFERVAGSAQVVGEGFALLRESLAKERDEGGGVYAEGGELWGHVQADDGRVDVGGWGEGAGRQGDDGFGLSVEGGGDGKEGVVADAGCGGDADGNFALHHEDGTGDAGGVGEEVEEDIGGDVVG